MSKKAPEPKTVRELESLANVAKLSFEEKALPKLLGKYPALDKLELSSLAIDFFDTFCDLNQVKNAAESHGREWSGKRIKEELILDTNEQWQYYAAFFYHRLTRNDDIDATYTPEQIENIELRMNCSKHETMGLGHDEAVRVLGSLIRESMNTIKENFKNVIDTNNTIPNMNKDDPSKLNATIFDLFK